MYLLFIQACRAVIRGLKDDKVDEIRKRMLSQRASTLLKRKSNSALDGLKAELNALVIPDGFKPQNHTIVAKSHEGYVWVLIDTYYSLTLALKY